LDRGVTELVNGARLPQDLPVDGVFQQSPEVNSPASLAEEDQFRHFQDRNLAGPEPESGG